MVIYRYSRKKSRINMSRLAFAAMFLIFLAVGTAAVINIASEQLEYSNARQENALLRQYAPAFEPSFRLSSQGRIAAAPAETAEETPKPTQAPRQLSNINPDYIGWLRIEDTGIDYPIVQGTDNEKYLTTSFTGNKNASGTVFMDSRCAEEFDAALAVVYGHNMKDGSMFAGLHRYLDSEYFARHSKLAVTAQDGTTLAYRIIAARVTDIHDAIYAMLREDKISVNEYLFSIGAAENSERLLALSTCTSSRDDAERLLVLAVPE